MQKFDDKIIKKQDSEIYMAAISNIVRKHASGEENQPISPDDQAFIDATEARFGVTIDLNSYTSLGKWQVLKLTDRKYRVYRVVFS
jgi:hypothetical protein